MSETEFVKIELELPRSLHEAIAMVAEKFDLNPADLIIDLLRSDIRSMAENNFQELIDEFRKEILLLLEDE